MYDAAATPDWRWFEERITYGNAKMSEALLLAYQITGNPRYKEVGLTTLDFLLGLSWNGEYFDLIGNEGWIERGKSRRSLGSSPSTRATWSRPGDCLPRHKRSATSRLRRAAFAWFLGQNRLGVPLYDEETGAVADGLDPQGPAKTKEPSRSSVSCWRWAGCAACRGQ